MQEIITADLAERLRTLPEVLRQNILGQDEVIADVVALAQRALCGVRLDERPRASMLFCGPTGVGKTELSRLLARHLFGPDKLARVDMSEYASVEGLEVLLGSSRDDLGILGHHVCQTKSSGVLLFDEVEKAHPLILDLFLQILSAARVTLANGQTLDLRGYLVIATSNLGSRVLMESKTLDRAMIVRRTLSAVLDYMRPEIFRRFELKCVFNRLSFDVLNRIAALHLGKTLATLNAQGHELACEPGVVGHVRRVGYSEEFGAGPIENAALNVLGPIVTQEALQPQPRHARGIVRFNPETKQCFLCPTPSTNHALAETTSAIAGATALKCLQDQPTEPAGGPQTTP